MILIHYIYIYLKNVNLKNPKKVMKVLLGLVECHSGKICLLAEYEQPIPSITLIWLLK